MARKPAGWVLVLSGLILCLLVLIFWYEDPDRSPLNVSSALAAEPAGRQEPITPIPLDLKLDARKVALGKRMFHDPQLSHGSKLSCAHCHNLAKGGMDGLPRSVGATGKEFNVNTPTVFNSGLNFRQFWDGRVATLEDHIDFHSKNPCDMGSTWDEVIVTLNSDASYRRDFEAIYLEAPNKTAVKDAVATFERSLTTPNGKFDRYLRGDKQALSGNELAGYELFKSLGCISCHQGQNVGGNMYEKLGIIDDYFAHRGNVQEADFGRYNFSGIEEQRYEFRVPSLRNVALTAPYFHDASAATLEQAVAIMAKYQLGVDLSRDEIGRIVMFLNTLTGIYQGDAGR